MTKPAGRALSPPELDDLLCFLVHSTGFAFNRVYRKPLEKLGLTYPQYVVMLLLWSDDALTVGQIAERMRLDSGTLTPLLKRLEKLGMVGRHRSREDERRVVVTLTDQGSQLRHRAREVVACIRDAVDLETGEVSGIMQQMRTLRGHLEKAAS